jgi:hypothetical protein
MAETRNIASAWVKADPIHATLLHGERAPASVEVGCETRAVAISISARTDTYNLMLSNEGAIDLALRIISIVGRLRKLDRPTD